MEKMLYNGNCKLIMLHTKESLQLINIYGEEIILDTNYLENNYLTLVGKVTGEKKFSHEIYGEKFYVFNLSIPRLSGNADIIPITVSERLLKEDTLNER